jgi:hypothetical protein
LFIDYVRDRKDADVHVFVTTDQTGGGGLAWTLAFIGQGRFLGQDRTLRFDTPQIATDDDRRREFVRVFKLGLAGYAADTAAAPHLDVTWKPPAGQTQTSARADPWNYWVFQLSAGANVNGEESSNSQSYRFSASANRTTDAWKITLGTNANYNANEFEVEEGTIESLSRGWNVNSLVVKSLSGQWSAAVRAGASQSTFSNKDLEVIAAPGIEYDFFPYSESTRRILTLQYLAGVMANNYDEITVYDKTSETVPLHAINLWLGLRQPWGSVGTSVEYRQHLNQLEQTRLGVFGEADVRLFRGFSFNVFGRYERIRDQISLRKGGASTEEVLLRVQQLATGYSYFVNLNLSYRFGSIFNNIVNPRFER